MPFLLHPGKESPGPPIAPVGLADWLIPAAGGLLLKIDDYDSKISTWAIDHRPLFGSESRARDTSDIIYTGLYLETAATALATPSGEKIRKIGSIRRPRDWGRKLRLCY